MRRQDRKVTDIDEIKGILNSTRIIHLGMMDGDYPYVVPLHFGYEFIDEVLYIYVHGHHVGKKFDLIKANPHVLSKLMAVMRPLFQVEIFLVNIVQFTPVLWDEEWRLI